VTTDKYAQKEFSQDISIILLAGIILYTKYWSAEPGECFWQQENQLSLPGSGHGLHKTE